MKIEEFEKEMLKAWHQRDNPEMTQRDWVKCSATVQLGTISITSWADEMKRPSSVHGRIEETKLDINDFGEWLEELARKLNELKKEKDRTVDISPTVKPDFLAQKRGHLAFTIEPEKTSFVTEFIRFVKDVQKILNKEVNFAQLSFIEITTSAFKVSIGKQTESLS